MKGAITIALLLAGSIIGTAHAFVNRGGGMPGMPKKKKHKPVRSDLPYVKCAVCRKLVKHLARHVHGVARARSYAVGEDEIDAVVEKACDGQHEHGQWLRKLDIQESKDGKRLMLQERARMGRCKEECETIKLGCRDVVEEVGMEATEAIWKAARLGADWDPFDAAQLKALQKEICQVASGRRFCTGKKPKRVPKKRKAGGNNFEELSDEDAKLEALMGSMRDVAPGMEMYRREDIQEMYGGDTTAEESQAEFEKQTGQKWSDLDANDEL